MKNKLLCIILCSSFCFGTQNTEDDDDGSPSGVPLSLAAAGRGRTTGVPPLNFGAASPTTGFHPSPSQQDLPSAEVLARNLEAANASASVKTQKGSCFVRADRDSKTLSINLAKKKEQELELSVQPNPIPYLSTFIETTKGEITALEQALARPKRFINFCGGGAKGLLSAIIATILEEIINQDRTQEDKGGTWTHLQEKFDVFSGTSTGSIIAAGLAFKDKETGHRYKAYEIAQIYYRHLPEVFTRNSAWTGGGTVCSKYHEVHLEKLLRLYFKNRTLSDRTFAKPCHVVATQVVAGGLKKYVFSSQSVPDQHSLGDVHVHDGCRASGAAPSFFSSKSINGTIFRDGGVIANDASKTALDLNPPEGFAELYDFACGMEVPSGGSSSIDLLAALNILKESLGAQQDEMQGELLTSVRQATNPLSYMGLINPQLKLGMTLDSTSDLFIDNCFEIASKTVFDPAFLSMLLQLDLRPKKTHLDRAIQNAFAKIRSVNVQILSQLAEAVTASSEVDYFRIYARRRIESYDRRFLFEGSIEVMDQGIVRTIRTDEFEQLLTNLGTNPKIEKVQKLKTLSCVKEYESEMFLELIKQAHIYCHANANVILIQEFQDRKPKAAAVEWLLSGATQAITTVCTVVRHPVESVCSVSSVFKTRSERLKVAHESLPPKLDHLSDFLLMYYTALDKLEVRSHDHQDIEWVTEAILNKMFKVELYTFEHLKTLLFACQVAADDTNRHSSTRLDAMIAVLKRKIGETDQ